MKFNILNKLLLVVFVLVISSCSKEKLAEYNVNPNTPEKVSLDVWFNAGSTGILENFGNGFDRYAGAFTQHFAGNHATGIELDQYDFDAGYFNFQFNSMYRNGLVELKNLITQANEEESFHYAGAAKVVLAIGLGHLTDMYGDIPWSNALQGNENPFPTYDTQESIYSEIDRLLSEAIGDLGKSSVATLTDIYHGGDVAKWQATAYVLRARYENHKSKRDAAGSATTALAHLDAAYALGWDGSMDFAMPYEGTAQHRNPWYTLFENNLIIASEKFMAMLVDNDDPRLEAYWDDVSVDGTPVGYTGKCNGFGISNVSFSPVGPNGFFGKTTSPVLLTTFFEAKFIEAEAAMRAGQAERAALAINDGVAASISKVAPGVDATAYIAAFGSEDMSSVTMEKIMTEKYKAMFTQGIESWVDVRRHDYAYPSYLSLPLDNCTDALSTAAEYVRRAIYPQSELDNNAGNVPAAGKGVASKFNKLWWDQ